MPGETYGVMVSNIKEMQSPGGAGYRPGHEGDQELPDIADGFVPLPKTHPFTGVLTSLVVLQILAYRTAVALGRDIDKPRNLAKSVTVE